MILLYCSDPLQHRTTDEVYAPEAAAAAACGLESALLDFEALVNDQDADRGLRRVQTFSQPVLGLYRGWMLRPAHYEMLYRALAARGITLINNPVAYRHCHYLPESYGLIEAWTPRSVWLPTGREADMDRVMKLLQPFGSGPVILKDYVKSQKHYWAEACYIPNASDRPTVERVVRRFLQLQGDQLNEGLVFRQFVPFASLGPHAKSAMPLTMEFRLFYLDGQPLQAAAYWEDTQYPELQLPLDQFKAVARQIRSRFFTMDIAKSQTGDWIIVELGDGQVAGMPQQADVGRFYRDLKTRLEP